MVEGEKPFGREWLKRELARAIDEVEAPWEKLRRPVKEAPEELRRKIREVRARRNFPPPEEVLARIKQEQQARQGLVCASNDRPTGRPDAVEEIFEAFSSKDPWKRARLLQPDPKKSKPGWGRWGNQTRAEAAAQMDEFIKRGKVEKINAAFTRAEEEDRQTSRDSQGQ